MFLLFLILINPTKKATKVRIDKSVCLLLKLMMSNSWRQIDDDPAADIDDIKRDK